MFEFNDTFLTGVICFFAGVGAREVAFHVQAWWHEKRHRGGQRTANGHV